MEVRMTRDRLVDYVTSGSGEIVREPHEWRPAADPRLERGTNPKLPTDPNLLAIWPAEPLRRQRPATAANRHERPSAASGDPALIGFTAVGRCRTAASSIEAWKRQGCGAIHRFSSPIDPVLALATGWLT